MNPWIVAGINLLAWPGIGTYVGGHKVSGAIQAAMALIGGVLSLALIVVLFRLAMKLDSTHFDLESFMDAANSPTKVVSHEVEVSDAKGIAWKTRPGSSE